MTTLKKPLALNIVCDDYDKPDANLINEASMRMELVPSRDFLNLMHEVDFTRRGRFTWAIGLTDHGRNIAKFMRIYGSEYLPMTMVSSMEEGAPRDVLDVSALAWEGQNYARQPAWRETSLLRRAVNAVPGFAFPNLAPLPQAYINDHEFYARRHYGYHQYHVVNGRRIDAQERQQRIAALDVEYATLGGLMVEIKNDQFWVRLFPTPAFADFSDRVYMPKVRHVRGASGQHFQPRGIAELITRIGKTWGEDVFSYSDERAEDLMMRAKQVVSVGYSPNQPATVKLVRGSHVLVNKRNPLHKFEADTEHTISLAKALDLQRRSPEVNFLIHPGLSDIVTMSNATTYEGEPLLKDYQKIAVGLHLSTQIGYLNSCSPGMGKTVMQLTAMREKAKRIKNYRGIVITEANVRNQWFEEAAKWFPEATTVVVRTQADADALADALGEAGPVLVICSYTHTLLALNEQEQRTAEQERLAAMSYTRRLKAIMKAPIPALTVGSMLLDTFWEDICADEAVIIRNGSSKQSQVLWTLRKNAKVATALTATPINKSPDDMGRLIAWVRNDRNMFSGKPLSEQYDTTTAKGAKDMFKVFGPLVFRRDTSEIAGSLPTARQDVHLLEPSPAEKALANAAEKELKRCYLELVAALDDVEKAGNADPEELRKAKENLRAANGAWLGGTQLARMATSDPTALLQSESVGAALLAGQGLIDEALRNEPTKRAKFITEVHKRIEKGEQVIAFTEFATVAETLVKALQDNGINARPYTGKNGATRDRARKDFQDGKLDVLVCTQAAERGLTLHKASAIYHYDLPWTLEKIIQRTGRSIRIGSENEVVDVVFMVMQGTVEQRMANHLVELGMSASLVLDHARGVKLKNTETASAMSGLMSAVVKTSENKNLKDFGKILLGA